MEKQGKEKISKLRDELLKKGALDQNIQIIIDELERVIQDNEPGTRDSLNDKDLIYIPMNPLLKETVDLGGAEMAAGVYNVLGTAFVSLLTKNTATLALAGPVIEKIGFFIREAIKAYRTHHKEGTKFSKEFKNNISNGIKNLIIDITVHDSIYTTTMAYGLTHDILHPIRLSIISFFVALPPAIFLKYSGNELLHVLQKQYSRLHGFEWEKYYEARFILNSHSDPHKFFEELNNHFGLSNYNLSRYHDVYFHHRVPSFSNRIGTVKLRQVTDETGGETSFKALEIAHTLPTKKTPKKESLYNYFYSRKEKGKKILDETTNTEKLLRNIHYKCIIGNKIGDLEFDREMCYNDELRITLDQIVGTTESEIQKMIEIKVYHDVTYLMEAMLKVMSDKRIDWKLTTYPKIRLLGKK